jgi:hypothetical protein
MKLKLTRDGRDDLGLRSDDILAFEFGIHGVIGLVEGSGGQIGV